MAPHHNWLAHFDQFAATSPDEWVDASIPLNQFRNPTDPNDHTMAGEIPLNLLIVAPFDQSGLVIDQISLDSNGPGNFESSPVE